MEIRQENSPCHSKRNGSLRKDQVAECKYCSTENRLWWTARKWIWRLLALAMGGRASSIEADVDRSMYDSQKLIYN